MLSGIRPLLRRTCLVLIVAVVATLHTSSAPVVAQSSQTFPGGFIEDASSLAGRPRLAQLQIQAFLPPTRGPFTFPAPYHTQGIRLTDPSDCVGNTDCVNYVGYSYWRNINHHAGSDTMYIFLGLNKALGGAGPTLFGYNKVTDEVTNLGSLFDSTSPFSSRTGEGWYFSATLPTKLYLNDGPKLLRYDVLTKTFETVFDISTQPALFGGNRRIGQLHSSDDDRVHIGTVRNKATDAMLGCFAYEEDMNRYSYFPKIGVLDECNLDKSGRWLVMLENVDGLNGEDNRIIDLRGEFPETLILDEDGAAGHADMGDGYMVHADNWNPLPNATILLKFPVASPTRPVGPVVHANPDWNTAKSNHVTHQNRKSGVAPEQQHACGSNLDGVATRENEIVCFRLDGSNLELVVAPVMTDLNAPGGGDSDSKSPKGNLDVTGQYFIWTTNLGGNRLDAFLVKVPAHLLFGSGSGTTSPTVSTTAPLSGSTTSAATAPQTPQVTASSLSSPLATTTAPASNSLGYWKFDEGTGSVTADASSSGNTGTIHGAAWTTAGKFSNALSFNGSNSYVEALDADTLSPGTEATFSAWIFLNSAPTETASVLNKWSQTVEDEYLFGVTPSRQLYVAWQTSGAGAWGTPSYNDASGIGQIPLSTWTHIALVRRGATLSFYINGVLDASVTAADTNPFRNGITSLRIGGQGRGGVNRFFNGTIDEVRLDNRALSQADIQSDMNTPLAPPADATPPTVSITSPLGGATVAKTIAVAADASDNVGVLGVQFKLDGINLGSEDPTNTYSVSWDTTTAANGTHILSAVARDAAGNSAPSAGVTVMVANDLAPPLISVVTISSITSSGTTVSWATDKGSVTQVEYGLTTAYGNATAMNASLVTAHSQVLSGLLADTLYHFRVKSRDQAGNLAVSADQTFTTAGIAKLLWDPHSEPDLAGYKVYVGTNPGVYGAPVNIGNITEFEVTNLSRGKTYYFAVTAYDTSGMESGFSNEVSKTVP